MTDGHAKPEAEEEKELEEWATWKMLPEGNNKLLNFIFIFLKILTFLTFFYFLEQKMDLEPLKLRKVI